MSILLIGAKGQVGTELQRTLTGDIIAIDRQTLDLTQPDAIRQVIQDKQPDLIVNAAAYTAVDKAESEPELANLVNGVAPTIMAETAKKIGARLIHISTDYVFDGTKNTPYLEEDLTNPVSAYGRSKLAGEEGIEKTNAESLILRTAWVYGSYGNNFVKTMLRLGKDREEIRVVADQVGSPTWARDIAEAIAFFANSPQTGIYHFTNSGVCSWYDFALAIFEEAQALGFPLNIRQVIPITTAEYPTPAQRPAYSVLSCRKTADCLGTYPRHWRQSLRKMLAELYNNTSV